MWEEQLLYLQPEETPAIMYCLVIIDNHGDGNFSLISIYSVVCKALIKIAEVFVE